MYQLPPLNSLRAFEATARHLSFTKAADELHVTPAALSHQVKGLEEYLGVMLFTRLSRAIELTEAGKLCLPGITGGMQQMHDAIASLKEPVEDNVLVISCGPAFSSRWLTPRLYRFIEKYPEIDPRITANLGRSELGKGGVDVALRFGDGKYPNDYSELFLTDSVAVMCSPDYLTRGKKLEYPADLAGSTFIHDDTTTSYEGEPIWQTWLNKAKVPDIDTSRGLHFNYPDHCLDAAIAGTGVVLGRTTLAAPDLALGRLVKPFDVELPSPRAYYFVCPLTAIDKPKVQAFKNWLWSELNI